jgi:hypothetical protein
MRPRSFPPPWNTSALPIRWRLSLVPSSCHKEICIGGKAAWIASEFSGSACRAITYPFPKNADNWSDEISTGKPDVLASGQISVTVAPLISLVSSPTAINFRPKGRMALNVAPCPSSVWTARRISQVHFQLGATDLVRSRITPTHLVHRLTSTQHTCNGSLRI